MIAGGRVLAAMAAGAMLAIANGTVFADPCKNHYILNDEDPCRGAVFEPAPPVPALNVARHDHASVLLDDGTVLVIGGFKDGVKLADAEIFEPVHNRWRRSASLPEGTSHTATLLADGRVLVIGGSTPGGPGCCEPAMHAQVYDPATKTWVDGGRLIEPRVGHTATLLKDGRVLIAGGWGPQSALSSTEIYDPITSSFSASGRLLRGRADHTATLLQDGRVLAVRGDDSGDFSDMIPTAELYDPATGAWSHAGVLLRASVWHSATLLHDGRVLVAGGYGGWHSNTRPMTLAEIYDPADGRWTRAADMHVGRHGHSALAMPDGRVVIAGGVAISADLKVLRGSSVETFDPVTSTWSEREDLIIPRSRHTATLMRDGRMLIVGGTTVMPGLMNLTLSSVEAYRP